jgi:hypothetical protein
MRNDSRRILDSYQHAARVSLDAAEDAAVTRGRVARRLRREDRRATVAPPPPAPCARGWVGAAVREAVTWALPFRLADAARIRRRKLGPQAQRRDAPL